MIFFLYNGTRDLRKLKMTPTIFIINIMFDSLIYFNGKHFLSSVTREIPSVLYHITKLI